MFVLVLQTSSGKQFITQNQFQVTRKRDSKDSGQLIMRDHTQYRQYHIAIGNDTICTKHARKRQPSSLEYTTDFSVQLLRKACVIFEIIISGIKQFKASLYSDRKDVNLFLLISLSLPANKMNKYQYRSSKSNQLSDCSDNSATCIIN